MPKKRFQMEWLDRCIVDAAALSGSYYKWNDRHSMHAWHHHLFLSLN